MLLHYEYWHTVNGSDERAARRVDGVSEETRIVSAR
jgi:hypothetical protein